MWIGLRLRIKIVVSMRVGSGAFAVQGSFCAISGVTIRVDSWPFEASRYAFIVGDVRDRDTRCLRAISSLVKRVDSFKARDCVHGLGARYEFTARFCGEDFGRHVMSAHLAISTETLRGSFVVELVTGARPFVFVLRARTSFFGELERRVRVGR
jgi:hypothetical protein